MAMVIRRPTFLRQWQEMFYGMYHVQDQAHYPLSEMLLRVFEEATKVSEGVRKIDEMDGDRSEMVSALPIYFCWLLSACNEANIDLEAAVWEKYKGCCPYCGRAKNCMCITVNGKPANWYLNSSAEMPADLPGWQEMFKRIYGNINKLASPVSIWLHVLEEMGEVSKEIRFKNWSKAKDEAADCYAWLMAFCNKLGVRLDDITWNTYPGICNVCRKEKCQCPKV